MKNSEIVKGMILRSTEVKTEGGEVMVLASPTKGKVMVEAWDWQGVPFSKVVSVSSLRWY